MFIKELGKKTGLTRQRKGCVDQNMAQIDQNMTDFSSLFLRTREVYESIS
jgi:hypothetical protein